MLKLRQRGGKYLQIGAPLSFAFQQGIQDSTARLSTAWVIPTHNIVRSPHSLKEFLVHILGTAVVGHIGQVNIDWWSRGDSRTGFLGVITWK